jgi:DNA-binding response OmpR family regulator
MAQAMPCALSASAPPTIMVADDAELNRQLYRRLLQRSGYNVIDAKDGCETLSQIERSTPDLLLLDLTMPGVSGVEVLRQLRGDYDQIALPIIVVTGHTDVQMIRTCLDAGANDYVLKPIVWSILKARLETHLRVHQARMELVLHQRAPNFAEEMRVG